jgi:hypothetical protein
VGGRIEPPQLLAIKQDADSGRMWPLVAGARNRGERQASARACGLWPRAPASGLHSGKDARSGRAWTRSTIVVAAPQAIGDLMRTDLAEEPVALAFRLGVVCRLRGQTFADGVGAIGVGEFSAGTLLEQVAEWICEQAAHIHYADRTASHVRAKSLRARSCASMSSAIFAPLTRVSGLRALPVAAPRLSNVPHTNSDSMRCCGGCRCAMDRGPETMRRAGAHQASGGKARRV